MLAACGLDRLGLASEIGHRFDPDEMLPEAGQGALALQVRAGEEELVAAADDAGDAAARRGRARVRGAVGGGCLAPVAAHHDGEDADALVAAEDGELDRAAQRATTRRALARELPARSPSA